MKTVPAIPASHPVKYKTAILPQALLAGLACAAAACLHAQDAAPLSTTATGTAAETSPATGPVVQMDRLEVRGHRMALQMSLDTKRSAGAIIDVITAEDVGKFPDNNVAESLSRMPGITVDRLFGEGEKVSILGTDPALNRTLLNGQTVASADWFVLDQPGRTFNYTLLASEIIGRAEIYKTTEARIDEGSIGGTVILHTRSPFDMPSNTIAGSAALNYNTRRGTATPNFSLLYSWRDPSNKFGVTIAGQSAQDKIRRDGVESYGTVPATTFASSSIAVLEDNPDARGPNAIGTAYFNQDRKRLGYNATAIWKPSEQFDLTFNTLYVKADFDNINQSMYVFPANQYNSVMRATAATVNNGIIDSMHFDNALSVLDVQYREAEVKTYVYDLKGAFHGENWNISAQAGTTKATGGTQRQLFGEFLNWASYSYDISGAPGRPAKITFDDPSVPKNPDAWVTDPGWGGNYYKKPTDDKETYGQADFDIAIRNALINRIRAGIKYRDHETSQDSQIRSVAGEAWAASKFGARLTPSDFLDGISGVTDDMKRRVIIDGSAMADAIAALGLDHSLSPDYSNIWDVQEKISAAYAQADYGWDKITGNIGLRAVRTRQTSTGFVTDPNNPANFIADSATRTYTNWLPSFNIAYEAARNIILRGAASQVIARANYADLTNYFWLSDTVHTGGGGNPDLDPYKSNNYDFAAEWYIDRHSILALNLFLRDIQNYILSTTEPEQHYNITTGTVDTYQISRPRNAGGARSRGFSIFYQQAIGYGFGVQANYTYSNAKADNGQPLPFNSRHQVNIAPYYEHGPWMLRVTYAWRSKYFTGIDRGDNLYTDDFTSLDATASYQITKNLQLSVDAVNILDETYYTYANVPGQIRGAYKNGVRLGATLRMQF